MYLNSTPKQILSGKFQRLGLLIPFLLTLTQKHRYLYITYKYINIIHSCAYGAHILYDDLSKIPHSLAYYIRPFPHDKAAYLFHNFDSQALIFLQMFAYWQPAIFM